MKKYEILDWIHKEKVIAIVRSGEPETVEYVVKALMEGGILCVEISFTTPCAHSLIEEISKKYINTDLILGAGTILDEESARIAILSGARFLVTPTVNRNVIYTANRYGVPIIPGIGTATEAEIAMEAGAEVVKLFPAEQYDPNFIKSLKAPLPQLGIVPTGGINRENIKAWFSAGAFACGVGGSLFSGMKEGDYARIIQNAKELKKACEY